MTYHTNGIWEDLNERSYQTVLGYIGWLILITFIIIKWAAKLSDFLNNKCLKSLRHAFQLILTALNYLDNCCTLITDDVDENIPLITFRENVKSGRVAKIELKGKKKKEKNRNLQKVSIHGTSCRKS